MKLLQSRWVGTGSLPENPTGEGVIVLWSNGTISIETEIQGGSYSSCITLSDNLNGEGYRLADVQEIENGDGVTLIDIISRVRGWVR